MAFEAWGKGLSPVQFLEREKRLRATAFARSAMQNWFWIGESGDVLSSCETFELPAVFDGREGRVLGIASVLTEPRFRGKGYAAAMLAALCGEREALAFHLYSEIGASLYERLGFRALPSWEWGFTAFAGELPCTPVLDTAGAVERAHLGLRKAAEARGELAVFPTLECLEWHWARADIYASLLGREAPGEATRIVQAPGVLTVWAADLKNSVWRALLWLEDGALVCDVESVLATARAQAARLGLARVAVWETPATGGLAALAAAVGGKRVARDGELAMVRPALAWSEVHRAHWV